MFAPARIVVLDDKTEHLRGIEETIRDLGSSCVCLTYSSHEDPPEKPFARARIIFMDLQLRTDQFNTDFKMHFAEIQRLLTKLIKPGAGPYLLVIWTAKPERVDQLETYLSQHLYKNHPHTRPAKLIGLNKEEFINLSSGEVKSADTLRRHVTAQLESVPALAALLTWETEVIDASDRVVGDILRLASAAPIDGQPEIAVALRRLATEAVGAPNVIRDPRAAVHSALFPLLEDHVQYEAVMPTVSPSASGELEPQPDDEAGTPQRATGRDGLSESTPTEVMTRGSNMSAEHAATEKQASGPSQEGDRNAGASTTLERGVETAVRQSIWEAALAGTESLPELARNQAAGLNSHLHLGGVGPQLTSTAWGAICDLEDLVDWMTEFGVDSAEDFLTHLHAKLKPQKNNSLPSPEQLTAFQIRIGASCDYAQKMDGPIPYVLTAYVPLATYSGKGTNPLGLHRLTEDSTAWLSPVLELPGFGLGQLLADPRFVRSRGNQAALQFKPVNRLREQLLMQLISTVARHGDRPGIVRFRGEDRPDET